MSSNINNNDKLCENCEKSLGIFLCAEGCELLFCADCDSAIHSKGKLKSHQRINISTKQSVNSANNNTEDDSPNQHEASNNNRSPEANSSTNINNTTSATQSLPSIKSPVSNRSKPSISIDASSNNKPTIDPAVSPTNAAAPSSPSLSPTSSNQTASATTHASSDLAAFYGLPAKSTDSTTTNNNNINSPHSITATTDLQSNSSSLASKLGPEQEAVALVQSRFAEYHTDLTATKSRRLIKEGSLGRKAKFKVVDRILLLFNDCLVVADVVGKGEKNAGKWIQKQLMDLSSVVPQDLVNSSDNKKKTLTAKDINSFTVLTPDRDFQFIAPSLQVKQEWITAIQQAAAQYKLTKQEQLANNPHHSNNQVLSPGKDPRLLTATVHSAITQGLDDVLLYLLSERGEDANSKDSAGNTPMHIAIKNNNQAAVALLCSFGADVNEADALGNSPLHLAVNSSNYGIAMILASKGADILSLDSSGHTALWNLCFNQIQTDHIRQESDRLAKVARKQKEINENNNNKDTESTAESEEGKEGAEESVDPSSDAMTIEEEAEQQAREGAQQGQVDLIEFLIERGNDPDETSKNGVTLLQFLAQQGSWRPMKALLNKGAILTAIDNKGQNALHYAAIYSAGFSPQDIDNNGNLPAAIQIIPDVQLQNAINTIKTLLSYGAGPNSRDNFLNTPLHFTRTPAVAATLILYGARPDLKSLTGARAVDYFDSIKPTNKRDSAAAIIKEARSGFESRGDVLGDGVSIHDEKAWIGDQEAEQCLLCATSFSLTKRRHHCRRDGLLVCALCSTKQYYSVNKQQHKESHRVCDCCYNILLAKSSQAEKKLRQAKAKLNKAETDLAKERAALKQEEKKSQQQKDAEIQAQLKQLKEEHKAKMAKDGKSNPEKPPAATEANKKTASTMNTLNQSKQLLNERGNKLNELADKAAKMEDDAANFASLAQKLKEKKKKEAESWW
jgi:ankyrin repeat protein